MKAVEWAESLTTAARLSQLPASLKNFFLEIAEVSQKRGGTPNAVTAALKEAQDKFRAVCRLAPETGLAPSMFDSLLKAYAPEYAAVWDRVRGDRQTSVAATEQRGQPAAKKAEQVFGRRLANTLRNS